MKNNATFSTQTVTAGAARLIALDAPSAAPLAVNSLGQDFIGASGAAPSGQAPAIIAVTQPTTGHVGVTDDGQLTFYAHPDAPDGAMETVRLTLRDAEGRTYEETLTIRVEQAVSAESWGPGEHYVLARDADGWSVTDPGAHHRKVYISPNGADDGDGLTPETAVTPARASAMLDALIKENGGDPKVSWHMLYERGHSYLGHEPRVVSGESPLNPFVLGAYGEGARPSFGVNLDIWDPVSNIVVRDIAFRHDEAGYAFYRDQGKEYELPGVNVLGKGQKNLLFENLYVEPVNASMRFRAEAENITVYRTTITDARRLTPVNEDGTWLEPIDNRVSGLFAKDVDGLLIEDTFAYHNGWQKGYDPTGLTGASQPPSKFSHNFYLNYGLSDVTMRDVISADASSFGAQLRSGGVVDGGLFFDNNFALNALGGVHDPDTGFDGNASLIIDTVATMPSSKAAADVGAVGKGIRLEGAGVAVDTIAAHDWDDRDAFLPGVFGGIETPALDAPGATVSVTLDDVTVFNWGRSDEILPAFADPDILPEISLDNFARQALGPQADHDDLVAMWLARDIDSWSAVPGADAVTAYFREGFGYDAPRQGRSAVFEADARADGFRWDNRLNWREGVTPTDDGLVDLNGHRVAYGGETLAIDRLELNGGAKLSITSGKLAVNGVNDIGVGALGAEIVLSNAGQFIFNGYDDQEALTIVVDGGRVVNTGGVTGALQTTVRDGALVLSDSGVHSIVEGAALTIFGDAGVVGFDGVADSYARLDLEGGSLTFVFDDDGVAPIREIHTGRYGVAPPDMRSVARLTDGALNVDVSALSPGAQTGRFTLIETDLLEADLDALDIAVTGVADGYEARLEVDDESLSLLLMPTEFGLEM